MYPYLEFGVALAPEVTPELAKPSYIMRCNEVESRNSSVHRCSNFHARRAEIRSHLIREPALWASRGSSSYEQRPAAVEALAHTACG